MTVKKVPDGHGHRQAIEILELNDVTLELETNKNEFLWNELLAVYADSGLSRKYKKASLDDWTKFVHFKALAGYSIWKYPISDMAYNILNLLYMDDERLLENRGQARSESLSAFDRVLLYNGDATPTYTDHTIEAGTEQGTPFSLMDSENDYLYIGADSKFSSLAFAFSVFGSGYNLKVEYYKSTGTPGWEELTITDDTDDFGSDGRISFTLPTDWIKCSVNGEATPNQYYYIRISTTAVPTLVAQAYSILPGDSVPTLLAMSRQQIQNKEWCWCYFNGYAYMTVKNEGGGYYEGIVFIKDSSSDINKENYFESNHQYKVIYEDENYSPSAWAPEHIVVSKGTSFPASPIVGQLFYRTDQHKWYIYKGGATPTWDEIATAVGGGDMLKSVYDIDDDSIVDNSEKLEGSTKVQVRDHEPRTPLTQNFDFAEYEAQNIVVHKGTSFPGSPSVGQLFYRTDEDKYYIYKGGATPTWTEVGEAVGDTYQTLTFFIPTADITVGSNKTYEIYAPCGLTIDKVYIHAKIAPGSGKTVTIDIHNGGTTIFTTQGNRPSISDTTKADESGTPDVTSISKNDIISVDVDVATAEHSATDITIQIRCRQA